MKQSKIDDKLKMRCWSLEETLSYAESTDLVDILKALRHHRSIALTELEMSKRLNTNTTTFSRALIEKRMKFFDVNTVDDLIKYFKERMDNRVPSEPDTAASKTLLAFEKKCIHELLQRFRIVRLKPLYEAPDRKSLAKEICSYAGVTHTYKDIAKLNLEKTHPELSESLEGLQTEESFKSYKTITFDTKIKQLMKQKISSAEQNPQTATPVSVASIDKCYFSGNAFTFSPESQTFSR